LSIARCSSLTTIAIAAFIAHSAQEMQLCPWQ